MTVKISENFCVTRQKKSRAPGAPSSLAQIGAAGAKIFENEDADINFLIVNTLLAPQARFFLKGGSA